MLFEVIAIWTGGVLRNLLLDRVLRASVARQGFAFETPSPPDGFVYLADPAMGRMIPWTSCVLSVLPPLLWQASVLTPLFFRLQLVTFFEHIRSKRRLMEIAADRLSIRW